MMQSMLTLNFIIIVIVVVVVVVVVVIVIVIIIIIINIYIVGLQIRAVGLSWKLTYQIVIIF